MTRPTPLTSNLAAVLLLLPAAGALLPGAPEAAAGAEAPVLPMQADDGAPIWSHLQALGLPPARWAELLVNDADGNARTDFLDLLATVAPAAGLDPRMEVLAYAPPEALARIVAEVPGAVEVDEIGAAFLASELSGLGRIEGLGATLLVWEPRAHSTIASPCPAACAHRTIPQAPDAATLGFTGTGVTVAVLDTGVNTAHAAFATTPVTAQTNCAAGTPALPLDPNGHGTHVASIAVGDDPGDYAGIATSAGVWGVRVLDAAGAGTLAGFDCGVTAVRAAYLAGGGPFVATASLGLGVLGLGVATLNGGQVDVFGFDRVAEKLPLAGVPFTIAAGNWLGTGIEILDVDENVVAGVNGLNQVSSPGFATRVITVGAVTDFEARASLSALGPGKLELGELQVKPDVLAHGFDTWGANAAAVGDYVQLTGTSMATPGVAGVVALLLDDDPTLTPSEVKQALRDGAESPWLITDLASEPLHPDFANGYGLARAANSLALV